MIKNFGGIFVNACFAAIMILILGLIGRNETVIYSTAIILALKLSKQDEIIRLLADKGLNFGVTILTAAIIVKLVDGSVDMKALVESFTTKIGLVTIFAGILTAAAAGRGVILLQNSPEMVASLVIGTMAGVFFFNGVAVGPLIAAGFTYFVVSIIK